MNVKHILCPIDFSPNSDAAVRYASSLAQVFGSTLHFVHAYEPSFAYSEIDAITVYATPPDLEPIEKRLGEIKPAVKGVTVKREVLFGFPGSVLIDYANQNAIDLIVMATHGRTGLSRVLMGSVAETIVRHANCPVITVKTPVNEENVAGNT